MIANSYYLISILEGILTFISPCILPMLPVYFFYLAGAEEGKVQVAKPRNRLLVNALGFVAGFTIVFVLLGATATSLGAFLKNNIDVFRKVSGIVMIVFGLKFAGVIKLSFLDAEKRLDFKFKRLGFASSIIFGLVFAFGWSSCLGGFLVTVLLMAGNTDTMAQGILLLLLYSAGLGIPFIVSAVIFEKLRDTFRWMQQHSRIISLVSGIVLIIAGVLVYTDRMKYLPTVFY